MWHIHGRSETPLEFWGLSVSRKKSLNRPNVDGIIILKLCEEKRIGLLGYD
jgi:hypothetical protein